MACARSPVGQLLPDDPVWGLVNSRRLGLADAQILENIVGLKPEDLQAAWDYYREHPAEIDEDIRVNEAD